MIQLKTAIKSSKIKWKYAMDTGYKPSEVIDFLKDKHIKIYKYYGVCGFCERHLIDDFPNCYKCELKSKIGNCYKNKTMFHKWFNAKTKKTRIKYATKIYNAICEVEKESKLPK